MHSNNFSVPVFSTPDKDSTTVLIDPSAILFSDSQFITNQETANTLIMSVDQEYILFCEFDL